MIVNQNLELSYDYQLLSDIAFSITNSYECSNSSLSYFDSDEIFSAKRYCDDILALDKDDEDFDDDEDDWDEEDEDWDDDNEFEDDYDDEDWDEEWDEDEDDDDWEEDDSTLFN